VNQADQKSTSRALYLHGFPASLLSVPLKVTRLTYRDFTCLHHCWWCHTILRNPQRWGGL